ncbi:MAG: transposase [Candidatus Bathyarchaeia archaeon]
MGFDDEVWLELYPTIGPMWMEKGVQLRIATPGINRRINVFITMLYPSGAMVWYTFKGRRSVEYHKHERHLLAFVKHHRIKRIIQVQDNARPHMSRSTQNFLKEHQAIQPFYLPAYSPQLNDVECKNRRLKHYLCRN